MLLCVEEHGIADDKETTEDTQKEKKAYPLV